MKPLGDDVRISGLETRVVRLAAVPPIKTAIHDASYIDHVLVRLRSTLGHTGVGHLFALSARRAQALELLIQDLASSVIGEAIESPPDVWTRLCQEATFLGRTGAALMAVSAIDTAIWDVYAQALGKPLWSAIGGTSRFFECYASDRLWLGDAVENLGDIANGCLEAGFRSVKLRVGSGDADLDVRRVEAVAGAVAGRASVIADANQKWDRSAAIDMVNRLSSFGLRWVEEPVDRDDLVGLADVTSLAQIPIASGESWFGPLEIARSLEHTQISVLMPDLQRVGGVSGWLQVANLAANRRTTVSPHLFPEISIHLMCIVADPGPIEYVPWFGELFEQAPRPKEGDMRPADLPGLGLTFGDEYFA